MNIRLLFVTTLIAGSVFQMPAGYSSGNNQSQNATEIAQKYYGSPNKSEKRRNKKKKRDTANLKTQQREEVKLLRKTITMRAHGTKRN